MHPHDLYSFDNSSSHRRDGSRVLVAKTGSLAGVLRHGWISADIDRPGEEGEGYPPLDALWAATIESGGPVRPSWAVTMDR